MTLPQKHASPFFSSASSSCPRVLFSFLLLTKSNLGGGGGEGLFQLIVPGGSPSTVQGAPEAEASRWSRDSQGQSREE